MKKEYRDNGAIGALLDEYEKAVNELKDLISTISVEELSTIVDEETEDKDCRSIQTILGHVVRAGYGYVIEIRNFLGEDIAPKTSILLPDNQAFQKALDEMFAYNVALFESYPDVPLEVYDSDKKIKARWGQKYDVEQLFEHAIVHILRHRRQIERFLLRLR